MRSVTCLICCPVFRVKNKSNSGLPDSSRLARVNLTSVSSTTGLAARQYFSALPLRFIGARLLILQSMTSKIPRVTGLDLVAWPAEQAVRDTNVTNQQNFRYFRMLNDVIGPLLPCSTFARSPVQTCIILVSAPPQPISGPWRDQY